MADSKLTLKNGVFYRDGEKIPLEFGNKEQIQMLEKAKELQGDGVLARLDEIDKDRASISYTCMCGAVFRRTYTCDKWNELQHDKFTCERCGLKYMLDGESYNPFVVVKLEPKVKGRAKHG